MTKAQLIAILDEFPDNLPIVIWDPRAKRERKPSPSRIINLQTKYSRIRL